MIPLMVAFPLLFAFVIVILDTLRVKKGLIKAAFILGAVLPTGVLPLGNGTEVVGGWSRVAGIEVGIGEINAPFIAGELILFTVVALCSISYFNFRDKKTAKALVLFLLMHAGLLGAFLARDFFNFYIYMEIASVSAFALVAFSEEPGSKRAAFKYLILSLFASYLFIFAIGLIYMETGYLNVELVAENALPSRELKVALGIAFASLLLKAGIFPLHGWLPDAHSVALTPASALLSGIVVKAPAYGMILLFSALPVGESLKTGAMVVAASSIFFGIAMALLQKDAKRLLAYHTVSQMGYVLLGIATFNFTGAAYYAMGHSLFKGGLFLSVGSLGKKSRKLGKFGYRNAPLMAFSVLMLSLAIGGISPLIGSYAKGLIHSGLPDGWRWVVPAGTVGTLVSFTKLNYHLSRGETGGIGLMWKLSSLALALTTLFAGLYLGAGLKPADVIYISAAVLTFFALRALGVFEREVRREAKDVGRDVNMLAAVFVTFMLAVLLLQRL
ncbi:proton-conducting transporter membrane subunit [Thermococcus sp. 21S7]|uniref:proton-conducting transporter transmembrane domain-containing protein n=1 Tax=Thermococcus sp. 21S7 TaxID=1638221 RepID=UPI00143CBFAD|nr:proton-conducting transporter membrane subunit [Thermococcus sp. 21S7]NJE60360.1 monovalent cation/H+ antiporter subunit D family protein [Thermococcus sp. 21S7]